MYKITQSFTSVITPFITVALFFPCELLNYNLSQVPRKPVFALFAWVSPTLVQHMGILYNDECA